MLKKALQIITVLLIASAALSASALMQGRSLDALQRDYESSFAERSALAVELERMESDYNRLLERIEGIKRDGGAERLTDRLALEDLLRQSQKLASRLSQKQATIRGVDSRLDSKRQLMVRELEREMAAIEASLAEAKPSERAEIVARLNAMRNSKVQYGQPLPELPNAAGLDSTLRDSESDDPATMLAVADELQDAEDQLHARVAAIDEQLKALESSRALEKRANKFEAEERFFEESDRARVIARYDVTSQGSNVDDNGRAKESPSEFNAPGLSDADQVAQNPSTPEPVVRSVRIDGGADPSRSIGSGTRSSGSSLVDDIESLRSEKERLRKRAEQLRTRANKLRKRAESL